jgi:hypothetical protein
MDCVLGAETWRFWPRTLPTRDHTLESFQIPVAAGLKFESFVFTCLGSYFRQVFTLITLFCSSHSHSRRFIEADDAPTNRGIGDIDITGISMYYATTRSFSYLLVPFEELGYSLQLESYTIAALELTSVSQALPLQLSPLKGRTSAWRFRNPV